jgi:hypothetical protein
MLQLIPKNETEPMELEEIDKMLYQYFNVPEDLDNWYDNWVMTIGFLLKIGETWDEVRISYPEKEKTINWLESNFDVKWL